MAAEDKTFESSDRNYLIHVHNEKLNEIRRRGKFKNKTKRWMFKAPNRSFPRIPLDQSAIITIDDILRGGPDFLHQAKFILCRSILPTAEEKSSTQLVIDEPNSQKCLMVNLFNFWAMIRPGTILAIMHPLFILDDQFHSIQVENPQHVHIFNGNDPLIRDLVWKMPLPKECGVIEGPIDDHQDGNRCFADGNYPQAIEAYSRAIQAQPEKAILYSNRAQTYLKMEQSEKALHDSEIGLNMQPSDVKLMYRKAKSLIQLKRYDEAWLFLEKVSQEHEEAMENETFANLVAASKRMVDESKGDYDIIKMVEEAEGCPLLDNHADYYQMDKIEMKEIVGKGRGLVAKEEIKAGTLLMACKAFIFVSKSEIDESLVMMGETPSFPCMLRKACHKLLNNPELGLDFYKLYAGKEFGWLENPDHLNPVDMDRMGGIIHLNSFSTVDKLTESECGTGLWIMPSYFNHSCVDSNCYYFSIGDFLFIRVIKDVHLGEELLVRYSHPQVPFQQRRQGLYYSFQMECSCRLCQAEGNLPEELRKFLSELDMILDNYDKYGDSQEGMVELADLLEEVKNATPNLEHNYVALHIYEALSIRSPVYCGENLDELFSVWKRNGDLHVAMKHARALARDTRLGMEKRAELMEMAKEMAEVLFGDERAVDFRQWLSSESE